ncbi:MAG: hypothetical protein ACRDKA_15270, partial [Actinomycetota bacterium]
MARPDRLSRIQYAQERNETALLGLPNVLGVATGLRQRAGRTSEETCIQVFVERKPRLEELASWERVPEAVRGYEDESVRTDVIEISPPEALQVDGSRYRPVPGGCSIGPEATVSAGTLGGWACDRLDDTVVLLSNNHVISNLDTMPTVRRIVQPARLDGGTLPADVIGSLKRDIPLATVANPPGAPLPAVAAVDAAIGTITVDRTDQILQIGPGIYELQAPAVNMNVQKRGRRTRLTNNGTIFSINGTFTIRYRNGTRLGRVGNTFVIRSTNGNVFSGPGDSGSLIFNQAAGQLNGTFPVLGLLYAGGAFGDGTPATFACDINAVFGALQLTTICDCLVRAIIRAVFGAETSGVGETRSAVKDKEAQLRRFRTRFLARTPFGKVVDQLITTEAAELGRILVEDEEAFGLAVRAARPWLRKATNLEILESRLDAETVRTITRLLRHLARRSKRLRPQLESLAKA